MKILVNGFVWLLAILSFGASGTSSRTEQLDGRVLDCVNGHETPVPKMEVFAFRKSDDRQLWNEIKRLRYLSHSGQIEKFVSAYSHFEEEVKAHKKWLSQSVTDDKGKFSLAIPKGSKDVVVLTISFEIEDQLSYFSYIEPAEDKTRSPLTIWMEDGTCTRARE